MGRWWWARECVCVCGGGVLKLVLLLRNLTLNSDAMYNE